MIEAYRRVGGTCCPHIHFTLKTGKAGFCETFPPQYTALYPYIPEDYSILSRPALPIAPVCSPALATLKSVCYVTDNSRLVQDSIKSRTEHLRGDVTCSGLAPLHTNTHIGPLLSRDTWCDTKALDCHRYTYSKVQAILADIHKQNVEQNQVNGT
jgi:hypothetical protein